MGEIFVSCFLLLLLLFWFFFLIISSLRSSVEQRRKGHERVRDSRASCTKKGELFCSQNQLLPLFWFRLPCLAVEVKSFGCPVLVLNLKPGIILRW